MLPERIVIFKKAPAGKHGRYTRSAWCDMLDMTQENFVYNYGVCITG